MCHCVAPLASSPNGTVGVCRDSWVSLTEPDLIIWGAGGVVSLTHRSAQKSIPHDFRIYLKLLSLVLRLCTLQRCSCEAFYSITKISLLTYVYLALALLSTS